MCCFCLLQGQIGGAVDSSVGAGRWTQTAHREIRDDEEAEAVLSVSAERLRASSAHQ